MLRFPFVVNKPVLILVALVTVVFTGKTLLDITSDRKQVVISSERLSRGFASALNEHAIRTFSNAENTMDALIQDIQGVSPQGMPAEKQLHQLLSGYMRRNPFSPILFVAAPDGRVHSASSEYPVRTKNISDREYFQHHLTNPDKNVYISRPIHNRLTGSWLIFLTKRLSNPDGSLRMIVGISIDPLYFSDFYRTIELGKHDRIFLFRKDGAILTLEPFNEKFMDKILSTTQIINSKLPKESQAGTFRMEHGVVDEGSRIVSYRFSSQYPVISVVSLNEGDVLARWRIRSTKSAGGALLLVVLVGTLGLLVYRQIEKLKQSEDKYSLIATTANEGIWMLDADARITYVNPRVADMFGYQPGEMTGRPIGDFMCPDELSDHENRMQCRKQGVAERYERRFQHKDGTEVWTVISAAALIDDGDGFQGVVAMCVDISDRKKSEQRQVRLEEELRQAHKMEAVGILAGGMAHDFNNLLQSITAYVFLAKMSTAPDSEAQAYLDEADKISSQASELGQRLLILSQGGVTMLRAASLPPLILSHVSSALEGTSITGEFDLPVDMPLVTMDESLIIQVISHLTTNAVEIMPQGGTLRISGKVLTISIKHDLPLCPGDYVHIAFSDTGDGIPPANLPKIFDPYFSTKEKRSEKGMGLGLALCHTIIKKHKGMISASSSVGAGTTINIYIPVAGADATSPFPLQRQ
jgi:PAS domain S-box-containing protein